MRYSGIFRVLYQSLVALWVLAMAQVHSSSLPRSGSDHMHVNIQVCASEHETLGPTVIPCPSFGLHVQHWSRWDRGKAHAGGKRGSELSGKELVCPLSMQLLLLKKHTEEKGRSGSTPGPGPSHLGVKSTLEHRVLKAIVMDLPCKTPLFKGAF